MHKLSKEERTRLQTFKDAADIVVSAADKAEILTTALVEVLQDDIQTEPAWLRKVRALWPDGDNKIAAIKEARAQTGMGLKEAKEFVEKL